MDTRRLLLSELSVRQVPRSKPAHAALRTWDVLVGCSVGPGGIYGPLSTPKSPYPVAPSYRIRSICDCAGCADQDRPIGIARERASPASMPLASHGTVKHTVDEYVRREGDRIVTTNTVEGFFSILKRGIYGVYQHVSEAHLHRYLSEFDFRYSNRERLGVNDTARASLALKGAKGRRLTYETTH